MNCCNTYSLKNAGKGNKYDLILDYVARHRDGKWRRIDLLFLSGYIDRDLYEELDHPEAKEIMWHGVPSYSRSARGWCVTLTTTMREKGALAYDPKSKRWSIGPNFDKIYKAK